MAERKGVPAHMLAGPELALNGPSAIREGYMAALHGVVDQIISGDGSLDGVAPNQFLVKAPMPAFPVVDISDDRSSLNDGLTIPVEGGEGFWNGTENMFFRRIVHAYLCAVCGALGEGGLAAAVPIFPRMILDPATRQIRGGVSRRFNGLKYTDSYMPKRTSTSMFVCICDGVTRGMNISPSHLFIGNHQLVEYVTYSIRHAIFSRGTRFNATVKSAPLVIFVPSYPRATREAVENVLDPEIPDEEGIRPHLDRCRLFVCDENGKFPGWDDRDTDLDRVPVFIISIWHESTWRFVKTPGSADGVTHEPNAQMRATFRMHFPPKNAHLSNLRQAEAAVRVLHRFGNDARDRAIRAHALLEFAEETDYDVLDIVKRMIKGEFDPKPVREAEVRRTVGMWEALTAEALAHEDEPRGRRSKAPRHSDSAGDGLGSFVSEMDSDD